MIGGGGMNAPGGRAMLFVTGLCFVYFSGIIILMDRIYIAYKRKRNGTDSGI